MMFGILDALKLAVGAVAGAALCYVFLATVTYNKGWNEGRAALVQEVSKQNKDAGVAAGKAKSSVDACYDAGGNWNQEAGTCDR